MYSACFLKLHNRQNNARSICHQEVLLPAVLIRCAVLIRSPDVYREERQPASRNEETL
ncbi:hypothetical protein [Methanosarcina mazei]|uniref:hypothetical protein n=1 Tax=Methanosarcina mazei TaxID=2209 RepID=UPI0018B01980|nr:hypothetical protein [Methanosarcina mazei]